jgi:SAM-dependent methyltransferase
MTVLSWDMIGRQFRQPSGTLGRLMGHLMVAMNRRPYTLAIRALEARPGDHLVDLGCGPGEALRRLAARRPGQVTGIDISDAMLAQARRRNRRAIAEGRVSLLRGSFHRLSLPDRSVDRLLAVNVAYFWQDFGPVLAELRRVLREDGLLAIYVTDASTMSRWRFAGPDTHRLFDADQLARALEGGGFALHRLDRVRVVPGVNGLIAACRPTPDSL